VLVHEAVNLYIDKHSDRYVLPLLDHFKSTLIVKITAPMIRAAAEEIYPHAGPATRNRQVVTPCQAIINHAADQGLCPKISVRRFPVVKRSRPAGSKSWLAVFQAAARTIGKEDIAIVARMMFETGARIGQASMLTWDDVNLADGYIIFRTAKTGPNGPEESERVAWMTTALLAELANLPRRPYRVFVFGCKDTAQKHWKKVIETGVPKLTTHEAGRHGFGTEMVVRNGVDAATAADAGGWKSKRLMMDTYVHGDRRREVIDKVFGDNRTRKRHNDA